MKYGYEHFGKELLREHAHFGHEAAAPGSPFPHFDLPTTDGGRLRRADLLGRPALIVTASITCPMTASSASGFRRLHRELGDEASFVAVYVREAHPGERFPQPADLSSKVHHARLWKERDQVPFPVAVDDVEGSLDRALGGHPHAAWLLDSRGNVAARFLWANDTAAIEDTLESLLDGERIDHPDVEHRLLPLLRGIGSMDETLGSAGRAARSDVLHAAPPIYGLARMAGLFRPLRPLGRTAAALGVLGVATAGAALALPAAARRMHR